MGDGVVGVLDIQPFLDKDGAHGFTDRGEVGFFPLAQVSAAHPDEFRVMVVDGAGSHVAKALAVPENIVLYRLPPYAPQLYPQEQLGDKLREKEFPNRVFESMEGVRQQLNEGLPRLASDHVKMKSICAWPWIIDLILNAI